MTIFERIKMLRIKQGMNLDELAKKVGYHGGSAISKIENGERNINHEMLIKYAEALDVSTSYLLFGDEDPKSELRPIIRKRFPMLGEIACGQPIFASEDHESYVDASADIDADFCLTARGDSMIGARINDGDVVFIKKMPVVQNGDIAAVVIGDEATLKVWHFDANEKKLVLMPENRRYSPLVFTGAELDTVICLGKAVCFMSNL